MGEEFHERAQRTGVFLWVSTETQDHVCSTVVLNLCTSASGYVLSQRAVNMKGGQAIICIPATKILLEHIAVGTGQRLSN